MLASKWAIVLNRADQPHGARAWRLRLQRLSADRWRAVGGGGELCVRYEPPCPLIILCVNLLLWLHSVSVPMSVPVSVGCYVSA